MLVTIYRDSAVMWLRRSADAGDPRAVSNLAYLLLNDTVSSRTPKERLMADSTAYVYLKKVVNAQIPTAFSMLGDMYRDGRWVKRDTLKAAANYEAALERGLGDAEARLIALMGRRWQRLSQDSAFNLGLRYYTGYAPGAGVLLLERAAEIPDTIGIGARAMALLGDAYSRGVGVRYSHDKSLAYFARAALAGNPSAMLILAETLEVFPTPCRTCFLTYRPAVPLPRTVKPSSTGSATPPGFAGKQNTAASATPPTPTAPYSPAKIPKNTNIIYANLQQHCKFA